MTAPYPWLLIRLMAMLLLGSIGLQALPNDDGLFEQHQGSAFSMSTSDVALLAISREAAAQSPALPTPHVPPPYVPVGLLGPRFFAAADVPAAEPYPVGDTPADFLASQLGPRPPPVS